MKTLSRTILLFLIVFSASCGKIEPYNTQLLLYATLSNTNNTPTLVIDQSSSSSAISINGAPEVQLVNNRYQIQFSNITIKDELGTYKIENVSNNSPDIISETYNTEKDEWREDSENFLYPEVSQTMDVVLVLDVSGSLGQDVSKVKQYAIEFIDKLFSEVQQPRVAVVGFSNSISTQNFTSSKTVATNFISNLQGGDGTLLYEAMGKGVDFIETSTADGKVLVTFTDGNNNAAIDPQYSTHNYLLGRLNDNGIPSYVIGFDGQESVDKEILTTLAVDGLYAFPTTISDLQNVFQKFANSVVANYTFIYSVDKNSLLLSSSNSKLRFRIKTTVY